MRAADERIGLPLDSAAFGEEGCVELIRKALLLFIKS